MLKEWEKSEKPSEGEIKARLEAVKEKLARQQLLIKEKNRDIIRMKTTSNSNQAKQKNNPNNLFQFH